VLDGFTLNPGDLDWTGLEALGDCTVYDRTAPEDVIERAKDAGIVLTNKTVLDADILAKLPNLKYIGVMATGYNVIDLAAADKLAIPVTNVPLYATNSVVQAVFAYILEFAQHVALHSESVHSGKWAASADFSYCEAPLTELDGLTLGIVGYGRIGRGVAQVARAFGMNVLVYGPRPVATGDPDIKLSSLDELLKNSDIVSLHCPLTDETKGLINKDSLAMMKQSAILINTGRGPLINDLDLVDALEKGIISGAALDVLTEEPPRSGNPLIGVKNCIITPHIAWATHAARSRLMQTVRGNVEAYINHEPVNVVNNPV